MLLKTEDNTINYVYIHLFFASVPYANMYACSHVCGYMCVSVCGGQRLAYFFLNNSLLHLSRKDLSLNPELTESVV